MEEEQKMIEVHEARAMLYIPEDAVEIELSAKLYQKGGDIVSVSKTLDMHEIQEAIRKAEDGYIDEDDIFELTDNGREYLDSLNERVVL